MKTKEQIRQIIEEAFTKHVFAISLIEIGPFDDDTKICGKDDFINEVVEKLTD